MSDQHYVRNAVLPWLKRLVVAHAETGKACVTDLEGFEAIKMRFNLLEFSDIDGDIFEHMGMRWIYTAIKSKLAWHVSVVEKDPTNVKILETYSQLFPAREELVETSLDWCSLARGAAKESGAALVFFLATSVSMQAMRWGRGEWDLIADITDVPFDEHVVEALRCIVSATDRPLGEFEVGPKARGFISASKTLVSFEERDGRVFVRDFKFSEVRGHFNAGRVTCEVVDRAFKILPAARAVDAGGVVVVMYVTPDAYWNSAICKPALGTLDTQKAAPIDASDTQIIRDTEKIPAGAHVMVLTGDIANAAEIHDMFAKGAAKVTLVGGALKGVNVSGGGNIMRALGASSIMSREFPRVRVTEGLPDAAACAKKATQTVKGTVVVLVAPATGVAVTITETLTAKCFTGSRRCIAVIGESLRGELAVVATSIDASVSADWRLLFWKGGAGRPDLVTLANGIFKHKGSVGTAPAGSIVTMQRGGQCKLTGAGKNALPFAADVAVESISSYGYIPDVESALYAGATTLVVGPEVMGDELAVVRFSTTRFVVAFEQKLLCAGQNQAGFSQCPVVKRRKRSQQVGVWGENAADQSTERPTKKQKDTTTWDAYLSYEGEQQRKEQRPATEQEERVLTAAGGRITLQKLCSHRWP